MKKIKGILLTLILCLGVVAVAGCSNNSANSSRENLPKTGEEATTKSKKTQEEKEHQNEIGVDKDLHDRLQKAADDYLVAIKRYYKLGGYTQEEYDELVKDLQESVDDITRKDMDELTKSYQEALVEQLILTFESATQALNQMSDYYE
ncbi:MAG: hypothetical protein LBV67_03030 [Streptococcaceae bacterium]|jgi:hypothetical protein|nr:hypothetical protein [Streptococcaceae bacterium]